MKHAIIFAAAMAASGVTVGAVAQATNLLVENPIEVRSGSDVLDSAYGKITSSVDHMGFEGGQGRASSQAQEGPQSTKLHQSQL